MNQGNYFGNYRIITAYDGEPVVIARDGSSVTYSARHTETGKLVTLKVLPVESVETRDLPLFEAEATKAQLLDHPNIARVRDLGFANDAFFCAMEPVNGQTLAAWIATNDPMPVEAALRIARQVVGALGAAAFHSVPHNSISPDNIVVVPGTSPEGERPYVKVLGFGLARLKPPAPNADFDDETPLAAYQFAAPEQLDHGAVDFRTQIYSLGCTLWYLINGQPPFIGSPAAVTAQQLMAEPPLDQLDRHPKVVRELLGKMLQKDPSRRPQDPVMLGDEIGLAIAHVTGRSTLARRFALLKKKFLSGDRRPAAAVIPVAVPPSRQPEKVGDVVEENVTAPEPTPIYAAPLQDDPDELPAFADTPSAAAGSTFEPAPERTESYRGRSFAWSGRQVAVAAVILVCGLTAAILLPQIFTFRDSDDVAGQPEPIGEPVGVVAPVQATPVPEQEVAAATQPAPTAAPVEETEPPAVAAAPPPPAATEPAPAASPSPNTLVAAGNTKAAEEEAEPEPPAEAPEDEAETTSVAAALPPPSSNEQESAPQAETTREEIAQTAPAEPAGRSTEPASTSRKTERIARTESSSSKSPRRARRQARTTEPEVRRALPADFEEAEILAGAESAPQQLPRGQTRARFLGVAPTGEWVFTTPTGEGYVEPPPAEVRRALPADEDD